MFICMCNKKLQNMINIFMNIYKILLINIALYVCKCIKIYNSKTTK